MVSVPHGSALLPLLPSGIKVGEGAGEVRVPAECAQDTGLCVTTVVYNLNRPHTHTYRSYVAYLKARSSLPYTSGAISHESLTK